MVGNLCQIKSGERKSGSKINDLLNYASVINQKHKNEFDTQVAGFLFS